MRQFFCSWLRSCSVDFRVYLTVASRLSFVLAHTGLGSLVPQNALMRRIFANISSISA
jgi:hypothetical protein